MLVLLSRCYYWVPFSGCSFEFPFVTLCIALLFLCCGMLYVYTYAKAIHPNDLLEVPAMYSSFGSRLDCVIVRV